MMEIKILKFNPWRPAHCGSGSLVARLNILGPSRDCRSLSAYIQCARIYPLWVLKG